MYIIMLTEFLAVILYLFIMKRAMKKHYFNLIHIYLVMYIFNDGLVVRSTKLWFYANRHEYFTVISGTWLVFVFAKIISVFQQWLITVMINMMWICWFKLWHYILLVEPCCFQLMVTHRDLMHSNDICAAVKTM